MYNGQLLIKDSGHLGGYQVAFFNALCGDEGTWAPEIWNKIIKDYSIKSVVDIGCGLGFSTLYFKNRGLLSVGVEGAEGAIVNAVYKGKIIKNDYIVSSALTDDKFDLCWCAEFVEHVEEKFMDNYLNDFKKCKYIAMTHAVVGQPGHHHVNCQNEPYWIDKMKENGFEVNRDYTDHLRAIVETLINDKIFPHALYLKTLLFFEKNEI